MQAQSARKRTRLDALKALLLAGAAVSVLLGVPAVAEQASGLRGTLDGENTETPVIAEEKPTDKPANGAEEEPDASPGKPAAAEKAPSPPAEDAKKQAKDGEPNEEQPENVEDKQPAKAATGNEKTDPMPTGTVQPQAPLIPVAPVAPPLEDGIDDLPEVEEDEVPLPPPPVANDDAADEESANAERRAQAIEAEAAAADEVPAGTVPASPVGSIADEPLDAGAQREPAIESLNRPVEENPYEALGVRWGSFVLRPTLESGVTATSNADFSVDGSSAVLSETTLRLNAASDWSSHSATVDAFGTFRKSLSGDEVEDVEGGVDAVLELELGHDYRARSTFSYAAAPESAASPVVIANAVEEPITQRIGGTLGLEKDAGKARFAITGGVSHDTYGDADLEGGGTLSQKDRDSTLYTLALRAGYEISPALTPFVETEIGRDQYDQKVDSAGYRRSSDQYALRAGLAFDRGEKFSGEIAAGWMIQDFDDDRLDPLSAPSLEADVLWSPWRGTNVRLGGSTVLEDTTTPGESGSVLYSSTLSIERQMRANLTGNAALGLGWRDYSGSDGEETIFSAEASLTWWLNRYAGLTGRIRHESVSGNVPDRDTEANSIFLGLKLQR